MTRLLIGPLLRHVGTDTATVWVETDGPCEVEVLGHRERTWTVSGHHYALVLVEGLAPGSATPYEVHLDGEVAWPPIRETRPPSRIRTLDHDRPLRLAFGSCRYGRAAATVSDSHFDVDALVAYAHLLGTTDEATWPDAMIMLGDQVYADETSDATRRRIRARRDIHRGAQDQVADFEEYTWLYLESWTDPDVRWLLSNIPSAMIFDDHDVRDDWNTSDAWRRDMQRTDWWQERIIGGLSSYWVYQHLGNLAPQQLHADETYARVRAAGDGTQLLRDFAAHADREADGAKGTRWSYRQDFGGTRLIMLDSRCGRVLSGQRSMISDDEFDWLDAQLDGDYDHLVVGTSLPWLLPRALHDLEAWNEALCAGARGPRPARWSEKLRRAADLEHWASFRASFDRLARLLRDVGAGRRGRAPATICVLSGDVHHAYVAQADLGPDVSTPVYQLTCSPLHNFVPPYMKVAFRVAWSRFAERMTRRLLGLVTAVPSSPVSWRRMAGPFFGNELAELVLDGRRAETVLRKTSGSGPDAELVEVDRQRLSG